MVGPAQSPRGTGTTAFLALGSNLGDRLAHLRAAVRGLAAREGIQIVEMSPVYESAAHTLAPEDRQPDYLNAVVQVRTHLTPDALLQVCHEIERAEERDRRGEARWAARTLDIDILIYGQERVSTAELTIPHPRMGERRFVLCPLSDIAPALYIPSPYGRTVSDLLAECPDADQPARIEASLH